MKNLWKVFAALLVVALPFAVAACGSDDEEPTGPFTHSYSWTLQNTSLGADATTVQKQAALAAEVAVNGLLAQAFRGQGFTVDASTQQFKVVSETVSDPTGYDKKVKAAVANVLAAEALQVAAEPLPANAMVLVKRNGGVVAEERLK